MGVLLRSELRRLIRALKAIEGEAHLGQQADVSPSASLVEIQRIARMALKQHSASQVSTTNDADSSLIVEEET